MAWALLPVGGTALYPDSDCPLAPHILSLPHFGAQHRKYGGSRADPVTEDVTIDWDRAFADVGWFHITGITPAISESATALFMEAVQKALGIAADVDAASVAPDRRPDLCLRNQKSIAAQRLQRRFAPYAVCFNIS